MRTASYGRRRRSRSSKGDYETCPRRDHELNPQRHHYVEVDALVAEEPIQLLDTALGLDVGEPRVRLSNRVDRQYRTAENAGHSVRERQNALGVDIVTQQLIQELARVLEAERLTLIPCGSQSGGTAAASFRRRCGAERRVHVPLLAPYRPRWKELCAY